MSVYSCKYIPGWQGFQRLTVTGSIPRDSQCVHHCLSVLWQDTKHLSVPEDPQTAGYSQWWTINNRLVEIQSVRFQLWTQSPVGLEPSLRNRCTADRVGRRNSPNLFSLSFTRKKIMEFWVNPMTGLINHVHVQLHSFEDNIRNDNGSNIFHLRFSILVTIITIIKWTLM